MLARVPTIASYEIEHDTAHPRVWAIVLTGDASTRTGHLHRRAVHPRWRNRCLGNSPATRAVDDVTHLVPADRVVTVTTRGRPSVSVPVLSTTSVSTFRSTSMASALRNSTPIVAP